MDKLSKLKQQLRQVSRTGVESSKSFLIGGKVTAVDVDSCSVDVNGFVVEDVKLKAVGNGTNTFLVIPKIGSDVMMISIDGTLDSLWVLKIDELSMLTIYQDGIKIEIDIESGKVGIKNNSVSLYGLFDQLATLLNGFTLNHPQGPTTGLMPPTQTAVQQFETAFNQLLKDI